MEQLGRFFLQRPYLAGVMTLVGLALLPVALFLDLRDISDRNLRHHAIDFSEVITNVRRYYAENVVGRVGTGATPVLHNYAEVDGAIPIPSTMSLELGAAIGTEEGELDYDFVSDYPFQGRSDHVLTSFESSALARFRAGDPAPYLIDTSGSLWDRNVTLAMPVIMGADCVACHNDHAESTKTDWQVGDVRGLQTVTVHQPIVLNLGAFRWLLLYFAVAGGLGLIFAVLQFRLARNFDQMNAELTANNAFLADVSLKISKYLSPQVYRSIFSGERDVAISTERKKLTVFFSDIKDFTRTSEILQPEELTALLNEYFTEMSHIAEKHGATIDKFIGDAIVAFFGDPTSKGAAEDARACVRMALEMQHRLGELEQIWRARGMEHPFRARIGINTGFCNVGNFGSDDRMDYTIIGAEANLAARLESIAEPGGIVMSYETYAHAKDIVQAEQMAPAHFKGIAREVVPYQVRQTAPPPPDQVTLDLNLLDEATRDKVRAALSRG